MKKAGRGGVIVNMASVLGFVGFDGAPAYTAATPQRRSCSRSCATRSGTGCLRRRGVAFLVAAVPARV